MTGSISVPFKTSYEAYDQDDSETQDQNDKTSIDRLYTLATNLDTLASNLEILDDRALLGQNRLNITELAKQRGGHPTILSTLHDYYLSELLKTNPASFRFLKREQRDRLRNKLLYTFYLLYAQYQLDAAEGRRYTLKGDGGHPALLRLCVQRIQSLNSASFGEETPFAQALQTEIDEADKSLQLVGLTLIASWFKEKYDQFMNNHTGSLIEWMSELNGRRLYWAWGGGMLASILEALPDDFFNKVQAMDSLDAPSPVTGNMSWILYYTRFGINLLLLLKHTFCPSSKAEEAIPQWERFKAQWDQRKFSMLNDLIWGFVNMLCFFWLKGKGVLGYAGNVVTVALLLGDLLLTSWRFMEEQTKHNADMLLMDKDLQRLQDKIFVINSQLTSDPNNQNLRAELAELEQQQESLNKLQAKARFEWQYKRDGLINDWIYGLGLLLAASVFCCFLFPPAALVPAVTMILGILGATSCFVLTVIWSAVNGDIALSKSKHAKDLARENCAKLLEKFNDEQDPNMKKQLYLEMKALMAETDYQQRVARFQQIKLLQSILVDALIPVVIFASLTFMPLGIGLTVIAAALILAVITYALINRYEPKAAELPEFNENAYEKFTETGELSYLVEKSEKTASMMTLFKPVNHPNSWTTNSELEEDGDLDPALVNSY